MPLRKKIGPIAQRVRNELAEIVVGLRKEGKSNAQIKAHLAEAKKDLDIIQRMENNHPKPKK